MFPPPPTPSSSSSVSKSHSQQSQRRPKGLWKARVTLTVTDPRYLALPTTKSDNDHHDSESEEDNNKRTSRSPSPFSNSEDSHHIPPSPTPTTTPEEEPEPESIIRRTRIMDISSVASTANGRSTLFNYEDWEDLKDLYTSAAQQYETADPSESLPLIRGVIHECHRFQKDYQDPSTLFANPAGPAGSRAHSPSWSPSDPSPTVEHPQPSSSSSGKKCKCLELPTSFHAIFGTSLFLFGNLIAQSPHLTLPGEPSSPVAYWTAALDVFETGENLPTRTHGLAGCDAPEDWRMALVWGRTLVCLADERIGEEKEKEKEHTEQAQAQEHLNGTTTNQPTDPNSPFSIIALRRPPITGRMSLSTSPPTHLLKLAMDQFSRGIFHMPHPEQGGCRGPWGDLSRAKELYTLASEVLLVSEKLPEAGDRRYWAGWADSVFNQMQMEGAEAGISKEVEFSRGRCCLIAGSAIAEQFDEALEKGEGDMDCEEAEEAREFLGEAVGFFEKARRVKKEKPDLVEETRKRKREVDDVDGDGDCCCCKPRSKASRSPTSPLLLTRTCPPPSSSSTSSASSSASPPSMTPQSPSSSQDEDPGDEDEIRDLLAEALLTLANLTKDEKRREELYARAEKESRGGLQLGAEEQMES
ncbi:hypothetical protein V5O48_018619 [Marasmius crinis-equi]|uniref:Uncharacterized protein n=1 Tax=Marasmius crinis-equi TaxID=585013 RepID=A0ABR3EKP1_9AGAR